MKESVLSKNGMKMIVDSGWKEFDKQTNCLATGNVYASTQVSSFIRPYGQTECNGFTMPEGHLMNFDMNPFRNFRMPRDIEKALKDVNRRESVILYMFFVRNKDRRIEPFCWTITDYHHRLIMYRVVADYRQNYNKRLEAAKEAMRYITN